MHIHAYTFWQQKAGESPEDYEDAFCLEGVERDNIDNFSCAVADGATEYSYSGLWARMLVKAFQNGVICSNEKLITNLFSVRQEWHDQVDGKKLPWYAEAKLRLGAYATLVGLTINYPTESTEMHWDALAVGDSCLFQIRQNEMLVSFPLSSPDKFDNRPMLLSTNVTTNEKMNEYIHTISGTCHIGDEFYLMTDAIACWFLKQYEEGNTPWGDIRALQQSEEGTFHTLIDSLREGGALYNDDVTICHIQIAERLEEE